MDKSKPIKVLHVVGAMNRAGTETMLMNIYRNINHEKIQFDFISYSPQDAHYDGEIKKLGGRVIKLRKTNSIKELYDAIKKYGPYEAIHSHTLFHCGIANMAGLLAGVKVRISHAHTTLDNSESIARKAYINVMRVFINTFSTHLLACSKGAGRYLFGEKNLKKKMYSYFPNAVDYNAFLQEPYKEVAEFKKREGLENSIVIGHVGRFMEAKNHVFLLEVMKSVLKKDPSTKLLLVGEGHLKAKIEKEAIQAGIEKNIRFVGVREDIPTMMHSMDVFVFPSIYEGLGLVLLEAQASGIPCIVSEAIQPEADIGAGLVSTLLLADGPEKWADKIIEQAGRKKKDSHHITECLEASGYSLHSSISRLISIYGSAEGEAYEEYTSRLL
ncbi:glycosyltransferase family 1 protein [Domibacillus sp. PGB-M46]|uniref:glycosyltransferase family 1 protein n=1 Tax=Domibacillus sp. PGB-M46 TaxID=2910255 RepID=UPI001F59598D|nr:glycosyltransferase family 1 protein [Domibacillus sp. PGB-M46]MCI2255203.1 glycosyltransferase family 1 protein [Domibacillus sp. PGB-M46]